MITIMPITHDRVADFKATRLMALKDSPSAFGSTYAKESLLSDADWVGRIDKWNNDRAGGFLACDGGAAYGLVATLLDKDDASLAHLMSMWVAPSHRRRGIGQLLADEVVTWARSRHARAVRLTVTSNNTSAISFYERLSFVRTGRTEPYPNDASLVELEMVRNIASSPDLDG